ncbi:hypothetical protein, partial [Aeromonas caviae]|uniref:hypothetical protein n=1 Tax=Aeromonas caviae TaxID=648 RepID=UPI001CC48274
MHTAIFLAVQDGGQVYVLPVQSGKSQLLEVVQQRYTSAVISWATEEAPTEDEINAVLDDFEKLAFAG